MLRRASLFVFAVLAASVAGGACSSGDEFSASGGSTSTGGSGTGAAGSGTGGKAGDASTSGGSGGAGQKTNGSSCAEASECSSGYCTDGFCCDGECAGPCTTCKAKNLEGKCSPYAADLDPEGDCKGAGGSTDPCAGKCDGAGACAFPDSSVACGDATCVSGTQTGESCDGSGACKQSTLPCGKYQCGATTCLTSCSGDGDCVDAAWCNAGHCEDKKANGEACDGLNQCASGICATGFCCATSCSAPSSCSTGACKCGAQTCAVNDSCVGWYPDADKDTFGDKNQQPVYGCSAQPAPTTGYVKDNTDCYDNDNRAKPGQTQYFPTARPDGKFDFDCNGTEEKRYPAVNVSTSGADKCTICGACVTGGACDQLASFGCASVGFCPKAKWGYTSTTDCGKFGDLYTCQGKIDQLSNCVASVSAPPSTQTQQPCR